MSGRNRHTNPDKLIRMTRAHLTALALPDMDRHPLAVDVADLQAGPSVQHASVA